MVFRTTIGRSNRLVFIWKMLETTSICGVQEATPIVTADDTPYEWGVANIIRYCGAKLRFVDAFETVLSMRHKDENEQVAIIAYGPMVPEAMRAAYILKAEYGLESRIINMHTINPLDRAAIKAAVEEVGVVITVEEHQTGGVGSMIASAACARKGFSAPLRIDMIGVDDGFGQSAPPWQLVQELGLAAEHIADRAIALTGKHANC